MSNRNDRAQLQLIWGLVAAVAVVQAATWILAGAVWLRPAIVVPLTAGWVATLILALLASRRTDTLAGRLTANEDAYRATLDEVGQLQTQNAMLQILARSVDVPLAFQAMAHRIARLVPCDRAGLALLTDTGQGFETFTARVQEAERRARPRPDVVFPTERTALGHVVRTAEPLIVEDIAAAAVDYLDANVLHTAGFRSALLVPLVSKGRAVGTLNLVSRRPGAFVPAHAEALRPIAELLAVAHVAQQLHMLVGKYRTIEAMADVTLSAAAEINSALQTIIGHCDLLDRGRLENAAQRDVATIARQAARIAQLLEKTRAAAHERLSDVARTMDVTGVPAASAPYPQKQVL